MPKERFPVLPEHVTTDCPKNSMPLGRAPLPVTVPSSANATGISWDVVGKRRVTNSFGDGPFSRGTAINGGKAGNDAAIVSQGSMCLASRSLNVDKGIVPGHALVASSLPKRCRECTRWIRLTDASAAVPQGIVALNECAKKTRRYSLGWLE